MRHNNGISTYAKISKWTHAPIGQLEEVRIGREERHHAGGDHHQRLAPRVGVPEHEEEQPEREDGERYVVEWTSIKAEAAPVVAAADVFGDYPAAALTTYAFDVTAPGLGKWLIMAAAWLFAISTMISWSYYGEQGMVYRLGRRSVMPYKVIYCLLIVVSCAGFIETDTELDNLTALGTGIMLWANIPIMLLFGAAAMRAYHTYGKKLKAGEFKSHEATSFSGMIDGRSGGDDE